MPQHSFFQRKSNMKKTNLIFCALLSILSLAGCGKNEESKNSPKDSESKKSTKVTDSTSQNTGSSSSDITLSYHVTFDLNYENAPSYLTDVVSVGETVTKPENPKRDGYLFTGWFTEKNGESLYDFSTPVNEDFTLYAGWLEGNEKDYIQITFHYNYEGAPDNGIYYVSNIKKKRKVSRPTNPNRSGYYFSGWYTDDTLSTAFDFTQMQNESKDVYASWKKLYTFEAEDTDFDGKSGFGYSNNVSETEMIEKDSDGSLLASNGYFVSYLYYNGAFLEWNISSEKDVDNVTLITRLSYEFFDITVSPETYDITVNGTSLSGYSISLTGVENTMKKLPFSDYVISSKVSLKKGKNSIKMITKNQNAHVATYKAEAPMIDCIKLATNETLTFDKVEGNY